MKKLCIFFSMFLLVIYSSICSVTSINVAPSFAKEETTTYAKASAVCTLYKTTTMSEDMDNVLFVIPETYFVTVIEAISDDCLKVQYGNYVGYVDTSTVVIATFIPIVKYLEGITCDIKDTSGTQIWSKPSAGSGVLTTIPAGTKNIKYIAMTFGKIPSGGESNVWYYVSYVPDNNSTNVYEGYVYSENVTNLTEIVANAETNPDIINNPDEFNDYSIYISSPIRALIISLIAIPVIILVLIIIYKASKRINIKTVPTNSNELQNFNYSSNQQNYDCNYENHSYNNGNLRNEIEQMSSRPYIRKINPNQNTRNTRDYPIFPSYDSDDDLL